MINMRTRASETNRKSLLGLYHPPPTCYYLPRADNKTVALRPRRRGARNMHISMWSSLFIADEPEVMLAKLASCGYRHLELSFEHAYALLQRPGTLAETARAFAACAGDHGIAIEQSHLSFAYNPLEIDPVQRRNDLDCLKREIELSIRLGVKAAVLHVGGSGAAKAGLSAAQIDDLRTSSLQELAAAAEGSQLRLALENLRADLRYASELKHVIRLTGCEKQIGICLDTGHLLLSGGDPVLFVREAGDALIALHIADNLGRDDDHLFPFGGKASWYPFIDELRASNYSGLFNYEVPGESNFKAPQPIRDAILMHKANYGYKLARMMLGDDPQ